MTAPVNLFVKNFLIFRQFGQQRSVLMTVSIFQAGGYSQGAVFQVGFFLSVRLKRQG